MRWKTTKSQCFQDGCYMVQYVRPRIIFRERTETPNWTEKFLSTIAEWVSEQRKEINCYMVKVCKKAEKISFLFRGSNKCKNNIDISLKFSFDSMYPCTKPMRWKARGWGAGWGGERSHCHLVATLGNFYLLSFPFLFVIDHNNNQKQTALKLEKEKKCVWKKKKKPHLVNFCRFAVLHVNFSPNSDDKMSSFKCLLPIWPKAHVHSFPSRSFLLIESTLHSSKERRCWCHHTAVAGNYQWTRISQFAASDLCDTPS